MLLTITTTHRPATDLAQLLHQEPDQVNFTTFPFGHGMVCFSQADEARCTAAVMVQSHRRALGLLAVALCDLFDETLRKARVEGTERPTALPIEVEAPMLPCEAGPAQVRRLFEPLGYHVAAMPVPADPRQASEPVAGELAMRLTGLVSVPELLTHLCVLLPVLDGADAASDTANDAGGMVRLDAVVTHSAGWIARHPEATAIAAQFATRAASAPAIG